MILITLCCIWISLLMLTYSIKISKDRIKVLEDKINYKNSNFIDLYNKSIININKDLTEFILVDIINTQEQLDYIKENIETIKSESIIYNKDEIKLLIKLDFNSDKEQKLEMFKYLKI